MGFLSRFYAEFLPGIKTCVVEQGGRGTLGSSDLPAGCSYLLVQDEGPFDRTRCFAAGLEHVARDCDFVILSDDDVFIDALSIRANLRICERYDCATGFKSCVKLTEADTESVRRNKFAKGIDLTTYGQTEEEAAIRALWPVQARHVPGTRLAARHFSEGADQRYETGPAPSCVPFSQHGAPTPPWIESSRMTTRPTSIKPG